LRWLTRVTSSHGVQGRSCSKRLAALTPPNPPPRMTTRRRSTWGPPRGGPPRPGPGAAATGSRLDRPLRSAAWTPGPTTPPAHRAPSSVGNSAAIDTPSAGSSVRTPIAQTSTPMSIPSMTPGGRGAAGGGGGGGPGGGRLSGTRPLPACLAAGASGPRPQVRVDAADAAFGPPDRPLPPRRTAVHRIAKLLHVVGGQLSVGQWRGRWG